MPIKANQIDNGSFAEKLQLRRRVLKQIGEEPVIVETNGGYGELYRAAYSRFEQGCVFETDADKANTLARQRPSWAVYRTNCVPALAAGLGGHLVVNYLDIDPYGEAWPILDAWFASKRTHAPRLWLVVNDGLRQMLQMRGGWHCASMSEAVKKYGNEQLFTKYLAVCKDLVTEKAGRAGYALQSFTGYHCGSMGHMTHYAALLTLHSPASPENGTMRKSSS